MKTEIEQLQEKILTTASSLYEQVDDMCRLAELLYTTNTSQSYEISKNAATLAKNAAYPAGESNALLRSGMCASMLREYDASKKFLEKALALRLLLQDETGLAEVYHKLGNTALYTGNYTDAIDQYNHAIELRQKLNDENGLADVYTNLGIVLGYQGNYTHSLKYHLRALTIFEKKQLQSRIASSATNIGVIFLEKKNYEDALKMFTRALQIRKNENNFTAQSDLMNNIANVYLWQGNFKKALSLQRQVLDIRQMTGDPQKIAASKSNLGEIHKALGELDKANEYYRYAVELLEELNDKKGLAKAYNNIGIIQFEQHLNADAKKSLSKGVELSTELGLKDHISDSVYHLSKIFAAEENYQEAYKFQTQYMLLHEDLQNIEINRQITQMTMGHEMEQKEREAEIQRIKNEELKSAYDLLEKEKTRSDELLHQILPEEVATEIKIYGKSEAKYFESVTVLFCDIVGFTTISEALSPQQLIQVINTCYCKFDEIVEKHRIEKIKVIGDSYMCAGGVPVANNTHAEDMIHAAIEMRQFTNWYSAQLVNQQLPELKFRFGVNTGPLITGIVGSRKFAYDLWGDTVNVAARMEQSGEANKINISESTCQLVNKKFNCIHRGKLLAKNKGEIDMYFVEPL